MNRQELRVELEWFCGCGSPEDAARALLKFMRLHPLYESYGEFKEILPDYGVRYLFLYALDSLTGWFEHGGTVGGQWLAPLGEEVKQALEAEEPTGFEELFADHCAHGFGFDDPEHDCLGYEREKKQGGGAG